MTPNCRRASVLLVAVALATGSLGGSVAGSEPAVAAPAVAPAVAAPTVGDLDPYTGDEPDAPVADLTIDRWFGVGGQSLADVANGAEPDETVEQVGGFESPVNIGDDYATRLRTLLTPEVTGLYRFWVSGDDDMRLFMNTTGVDPAGAERIAYIAGWTTYRQWNRFWSQRSVWIELEAGTPYYLEAIGKEGSGDDHFSVAWELDDGFDRELIPARVLDATQLGGGGWRSATPVGLPDLPAAMTDPQWTSAVGPETIALGWAPVDDADWYEVRLEGSGDARQVIVDGPSVVFSDLVPDTRYLVEVAPASDAGRGREVGRVVVTASGPYPVPVAPPAGDEPAVTYDHWDTGWWTLTSVPDGLAPVSTTTLATGLEVPPMRGNNHASRLRAVITPDRTDRYTFHLSGDDDARLLFNADGDWAHGAVPVAYVSGWTEQYQWDRYASQTTPEFDLVAGESYYIEAIGVHALGLDHLEVGWSTPGSPIEVVPADVLEPTVSGSGGWRQDASALQVAPGPVRNVDDAWIDDTTVSLSWDAPLVTDEFGVAAHFVATVVGTSSSEVVTTAGVTFAGLEPGMPYTVEIVAVNGSGSGPSVPHEVIRVVPTTTTTTTTTTTPTTTTTTPTTTTSAVPAQLRLTFMCRAVVGGDITNDDYLDRHDSYPAGSYVWRVRSENEIGPVAFEVRVGGNEPFHTGELASNETRFFSTTVGHQGASVVWDGGIKGTASANETACGVHPSTPTTTPTTTTTTTTAPPTTTVPSPQVPGLTAGHAILATGDQTCGGGLQLSGSSIDVLGSLRSNGDIMVQGSNVAVDGVISFGGSSNVSNQVTSAGVERDTSTTVSGLAWTVADFALGSPLGPGVAYHRHTGYWWVGGAVAPGIHYVDGDVQISGSNVDLDGVTIVATGTVGISGPGLRLSPAAPGLPTVLSGATGCYRTGINLSASSIEWSGVLAAPNARVQVNGSDLSGGTILASSVQMSGSRIEVGRASLVDTIVDSGEPVVYLTAGQLDAANRAAKAIRKGLGS